MRANRGRVPEKTASSLQGSPAIAGAGSAASPALKEPKTTASSKLSEPSSGRKSGAGATAGGRGGTAAKSLPPAVALNGGGSQGTNGKRKAGGTKQETTNGGKSGKTGGKSKGKKAGGPSASPSENIVVTSNTGQALIMPAKQKSTTKETAARGAETKTTIEERGSSGRGGPGQIHLHAVVGTSSTTTSSKGSAPAQSRRRYSEVDAGSRFKDVNGNGTSNPKLAAKGEGRPPTAKGLLQPEKGSKGGKNAVVFEEVRPSPLSGKGSSPSGDTVASSGASTAEDGERRSVFPRLATLEP